MAGGRQGKNVGALSRKNEIGRLGLELTQLYVKYKQEQASLSQAERDLQKAQVEASVAAEEKRQAEDALLRARGERSQHGALLDSLSARDQSLEQECAQLDIRLDELDARQKQSVCEENEQNEKAAKLQTELDELTGGMHQSQTERGLLSEQAAALREEIVSAKSEHSTQSESLLQLDELICSMTTEKQTREQAIQSMREHSRALERELVEIDGRIGNAEQVT